MAANVELDPVEGRHPLVLGKSSFHELTEAVAAPLEKKDYTKWWGAFLVSASMLGLLLVSVAWLVWEGTGVWGLNNPVGWGWAIVNFVFWVGIGHAGTLISAILFLFRQKWRTSINRSAEAMTIFAVMCALIFPGIHVGRIWVVYWMFPLPNQMDMPPNFRSPLLWDVFAVGTYFTVSLLFWYVGLIPDLATMRDRAKTKIRKMVYGALSLGWRGSGRHWQHYEIAYLLLAAMATPLVLSVHTIVSFDFAVSQLPGWHTTIFPPYFVAGAIFSGFGMVLTLLIPARAIFDLKHLITIKHIENMAKVCLLTGSMVGYAYAMEFFIAWYSGNEYEAFLFANRAFGDYAWAYWIMVSCNVLSPQFFWIKRLRRNVKFVFVISIFINIGMWFERFVITVTSLHHDFTPSAWDYYTPTFWDVSTFIGSFGLFFTMFTLFVRYVPFVALAEVKTVLPEADPHYVSEADKARLAPAKSGSTDDESEEDDDDGDEGGAKKKKKKKKKAKKKVKKTKKKEAAEGDSDEDDDSDDEDDDSDDEGDSDEDDAAAEAAADDSSADSAPAKPKVQLAVTKEPVAEAAEADDAAEDEAAKADDAAEDDDEADDAAEDDDEAAKDKKEGSDG